MAGADGRNEVGAVRAEGSWLLALGLAALVVALGLAADFALLLAR